MQRQAKQGAHADALSSSNCQYKMRPHMASGEPLLPSVTAAARPARLGRQQRIAGWGPGKAQSPAAGSMREQLQATMQRAGRQLKHGAGAGAASGRQDDTARVLDRQASAVATHTLAVIVHPAFSHTLPEVPLALSFWEACCDAVLGKIAAGLDARSLAAMEMVSTRCRRVAADEDRWRALCIERFNTPPTALDSMHEVATWKEIYRFNHEAFKYLLAQTAAEAMRKLGWVRASAGGYTLNSMAVA